jgi:hypothetical protein
VLYSELASANLFSRDDVESILQSVLAQIAKGSTAKKPIKVSVNEVSHMVAREMYEAITSTSKTANPVLAFAPPWAS